MQRLLFTLSFLICFSTVWSQICHSTKNPTCATDEFMRIQLERNPQLADEIAKVNHEASQWKGNQKAVIVIPTVVHVLYRTPEMNISDEQIKSQIRVLNEDFNRFNADAGNTPSVFQGVAANCEIQFCLAQVDPDGNPTNGITRTATNVKDIGNQGTSGYYTTADGGHDIWDRDSYMNIWVCETIGDILGFAATPALTTMKDRDGVVIGYQYFGTSGTATAPNNKGRTTTHEVGHWFGLQHPWGNGDPMGGNCSADDGIADTPNQDAANYFCPNFPKTSCNNGPNGDMFMNYMDYTDDACMNLFTEGQKARMIAILNSAPRNTLQNSTAGCSYTNVKEIYNAPGFNIFPNPTSGTFEIRQDEQTNDAITVTIYALNSSRALWKQRYANGERIRMNLDLENGVYAVLVEQGRSQSIQKLVINR